MRVSQVSPAEDKVRNILVIGITGNGKSTLANVLANSEQFVENASSTSVTKSFQASDVITYRDKRYRIIDNIGFADTNNISKEDILFEIGKGINSAQEGINQVLFVFKGRFSQKQIEVFKLFKSFVAEVGITDFTTLVRTNFKDFRDLERCENDRELLLSESSDLAEIISSCNSVIYVDNSSLPTIEADDEEDEIEEKELEMEINSKKREASREIVFNHLLKNCPDIYKLKKWDSIYQQVNQCINKIAEDEDRIANSNSDTERNQLREGIRQNKGRIAEEVNANLGVELSLTPKFTAQIEMKNLHLSNLWRKES